MKYLVTGGCGFIGSHLVDSLCRQGHEVQILDDLSTGTLAHKPLSVKFFKGDIRDWRAVEDAMKGVDGCFHLAAVASVERGNLEWVETHRTNITGTIMIFDAARRCNVKPIPVVYASSAAVYGDNPQVPLTEESKAVPLSAYGADKFGCELHGLVANRIHGVPNCGLRFFNVYGPRQDPRSPYSGVITIFGARLQRSEPITINGDGYHTRDFVYVGDVVEALGLAMEHAKNNNINDIFNVCTGIETSVLDLANEIGLLLQPIGNNLLKFGPPRPGDPRTSIGDPTKAQRVLGFRASTDMAAGLMKTFDPMFSVRHNTSLRMTG